MRQDKSGDLRTLILVSCLDSDYRQPCCLKRRVYEPIPLNSIRTRVAGIIEFDDNSRRDRIRRTNDKINVFTIDSIRVSLVCTSIDDKQQITNAHFWTNDGS